MFDHLLESSHRDDSNNLSNIGFSKEIMHKVSIEVNFMISYLELWRDAKYAITLHV